MVPLPCKHGITKGILCQYSADHFVVLECYLWIEGLDLAPDIVRQVVSVEPDIPTLVTTDREKCRILARQGPQVATGVYLVLDLDAEYDELSWVQSVSLCPVRYYLRTSITVADLH